MLRAASPSPAVGQWTLWSRSRCSTHSGSLPTSTSPRRGLKLFLTGQALLPHSGSLAATRTIPSQAQPIPSLTSTTLTRQTHKEVTFEHESRRTSTVPSMDSPLSRPAKVFQDLLSVAVVRLLVSRRWHRPLCSIQLLARSRSRTRSKPRTCCQIQQHFKRLWMLRNLPLIRHS